jgi:nucleoside-diphosphate-sugar epimerase
MLIRQLVADGRYRVRAVARDRARAAAAFAEDGVDPAALEVVAAEVVEGGPTLEDALRGAVAVVIATGTTAFPTRAWGPKFRNSPDMVDRVGSENVVKCLDRAAVERVVYVSSIGTMRTGSGFFWLLNLCGVLNAKRAAEVAVMEGAAEAGYSYAVVRPGRLAGGPYTNTAEFGMKDLGEAMQGIRCEPGDSLQGDVTRSSAATAVYYTLQWGDVRNVDYSMVNVEGGPPTKDMFHGRLCEMTK